MFVFKFGFYNYLLHIMIISIFAALSVWSVGSSNDCCCVPLITNLKYTSLNVTILYIISIYIYINCLLWWIWNYCLVYDMWVGDNWRYLLLDLCQTHNSSCIHPSEKKIPCSLSVHKNWNHSICPGGWNGVSWDRTTNDHLLQNFNPCF